MGSYPGTQGQGERKRDQEKTQALCESACTWSPVLGHLGSGQLAGPQSSRLETLRAGALVCPAPHFHLTVRTPRPREGLQPPQSHLVSHSKTPDSTGPQLYGIVSVGGDAWELAPWGLSHLTNPTKHFYRILPSALACLC